MLVTTRRTVLAGFAATSFAPLAKAAVPPKPPYKLGASTQGLSIEFMRLWANAVRAHPAIKSGMATIDITDAHMDAFTQSNHVDTMITQGYQAIIFVPVDIQAGNDPIRRAKKAGIPVIGSNTLVTDKSIYASYIGSDDIKAGHILAEGVIGKMGGKGNVVINEGMIGQSAQVQRHTGIEETLKKYPNVRVLARKTANWSRAESLALMEDWITSHPDQISGVIAQNDEMAIGALHAMKAGGLDPHKIPLGGIDGITDALLAVQRREMMTTLQDANAQAQGSVDLALRQVVGPSYQPMAKMWTNYRGKMDWGSGTAANYVVPWVPVTAENVDSLLATRKES